MRSVLFLLAVTALVVAPELRGQPGPGTQTIPESPYQGVKPTGSQVCATVMKKTTKVVHGSVCKVHCQPHCLPDCIRSCFGLSCGGCDCGTLRSFKVLTKTVVPGPEVPVCRVKDLSDPGPSAPSSLPTMTPKGP